NVMLCFVGCVQPQLFGLAKLHFIEKAFIEAREHLGFVLMLGEIVNRNLGEGERIAVRAGDLLSILAYIAKRNRMAPLGEQLGFARLIQLDITDLNFAVPTYRGI